MHSAKARPVHTSDGLWGLPLRLHFCWVYPARWCLPTFGGQCNSWWENQFEGTGQVSNIDQSVPAASSNILEISRWLAVVQATHYYHPGELQKALKPINSFLDGVKNVYQNPWDRPTCDDKDFCLHYFAFNSVIQQSELGSHTIGPNTGTIKSKSLNWQCQFDNFYFRKPFESESDCHSYQLGFDYRGIQRRLSYKWRFRIHRFPESKNVNQLMSTGWFDSNFSQDSMLKACKEVGRSESKQSVSKAQKVNGILNPRYNIFQISPSSVERWSWEMIGKPSKSDSLPNFNWTNPLAIRTVSFRPQNFNETNSLALGTVQDFEFFKKLAAYKQITVYRIGASLPLSCTQWFAYMQPFFWKNVWIF